jgi:hypothetical protein
MHVDPGNSKTVPFAGFAEFHQPLAISFSGIKGGWYINKEIQWKLLISKFIGIKGNLFFAL